MALDFATTFGRRSSSNPASSNNTEERPQSQLWLNIGCETGDEDYPFLNLPMGIPLDQVKPVKITGRNDKFKAFRSSQNDFLAYLEAEGEKLKPGEDLILTMQVQLRRIDDEQMSVDPKDNPFTKLLFSQNQD